MRLKALAVSALCVFAACAPAATSGGTGAAAPDVDPATQDPSREDTPDYPGGYGTLHQDAFTLPLRSGDLLIKVTPLAESITRLAAPDTYRRLHSMAESRLDEARRATYGSEPEMLLVSFFSYAPDVAYRPEELQIVHRGQVLRPSAILPVTSGWGRGRLEQRELQSAIYVYSDELDYDLPLMVRYENSEFDGWSDIQSVLERERAQVRSRAAS